MTPAHAILSGIAGAAVLNIAHQSLQAVTDDAPRMEILGMRALKGGLEAVGADVPPRRELFPITLAADLLANAGYYSLVGLAGPNKGILTGGALGLAAGVGAVALPGPMGLGNEPSNRTPQTTAMTVGLYTLGGLAAGAVFTLLTRQSE